MRFTYNKAINRPRKSGWKRTLGRYYNLVKTTFWKQKHYRLLSRSVNSELLEYEIFSHQTVLMRNLTGLNRELQKNKLINLKLSLPWFNGLILRPGEIFSFWFILGQTTYQRGFVDGMVLCNGEIVAEVGGGLCQLSNLIYWMTLHTPLTVIERWRHGFDVFPDIDRTQPFGSGATIAYPGIDLKIKNPSAEPNSVSELLSGCGIIPKTLPCLFTIPAILAKAPLGLYFPLTSPLRLQ